MRLMALAVCLAAAIAAPAQVFSQSGIPLKQDDRLRILFSHPGTSSRLEALYVETSQESIFVRQQAGTRYGLSWTGVHEIERFAGRRGHSGVGALIGVIAGLGAGVLAGVTAKRESQFLEVDTGGAIFIAALVTGAGAGLGALIGSVVRSDRWEMVPVDSLRSRRGTDRSDVGAGE